MLDLKDLDEAQGITADMVRAWADAHGWKIGERSASDNGRWISAVNPSIITMIFDRDPASVVWNLAEHTRLGIQETLRAINPRMRKGLPSEAAMSAHELWMLTECELGLHRSRISGGIRDIQKHGGFDGENISHWPCDKHGNKVRYPVDDKGVML